MLDTHALAIPDVVEIRQRRFADARGYFAETYSAPRFAEAGLPTDWVQDNRSLSHRVGTVRGLHFQRPPLAQAKLVSVVTGAIFDVAVDLRSHSPTKGRWVGIRLSADDENQLLVPVGFAHGFMTLEPDTQVTYKVNARYSPEDERSIRFDDPAIGIEWPEMDEVLLSDKDAQAAMWADVETGF